MLLDWFAVGTQTPTARQSNMIKEKEENKQPARTKIYIGSHLGILKSEIYVKKKKVEDLSETKKMFPVPKINKYISLKFWQYPFTHKVHK